VALVVVTGYMVRHPVPGNIYAFLSYVVGFHRLGHQVVYLEESGWPLSCYDPDRWDYSDDPTPGLRIVGRLLGRHGAGDVPVAFVNRESRATWGLPARDVADAVARCDLLLDVGGVNWLPEFERARRRALVDMDPVFTQAGMFGGADVDRHHAHFTYGANVGRPTCPAPTLGLDWQPTLPPVVPSMWRLGPPPGGAAFATVANWSAYQSVEIDGRTYGPKSVEFLRLADVPRRTGQPAVVALAGGDKRTKRLEAGGWQVANAGFTVPDAPSYRRFIAAARAELSPAKHGYVASRSGWFSDRTVCFLASGRPAVVQDTGLATAGWLDEPVGVVPFRTPAQAADAVNAVAADWPEHSRAARRLIRRHFAHDVVLPGLLRRAGVPARQGK